MRPNTISLKGKPVMSWQPGTTVGAYRIIETLGSGGMAVVYRAYHERLDREVAVKVLHAAFTADRDFLARFQREARIIAKLEHPNIVPVYDYSEHDTQPYLVMKLIKGKTLKELLDTAPPDLETVIRISDAVAAALSYAHSQGVLHRDIKPSNVILDENGTPYLSDFGLARLTQLGESSLTAGMIVGTPNYVSPEQADGTSEITEKADIYSFGVMLYEMLAGRVPFLANTPYATIHKHIYEQPEAPSSYNSEIPPAVDAVILQALAKNPASRYDSAVALAAAFRQALGESGLRALNPERSHLVPRTPILSQTPTPVYGTPTPVYAAPLGTPMGKPKREFVNAPPVVGGTSIISVDGMLLLAEETSWATLPRDEIIRRRLEQRRGEIGGFIGHLLPFIGVNAFIILGGLARNSLEWGNFITLFAWGAGLGAHAITTLYHTARYVERLYQQFYARMSESYGQDWRETLDSATLAREWELEQENYQNRMGFAVHAVVFASINIMLNLIYFGIAWQNGRLELGFPWTLIVLGGWGAGLLGHWFGLRQNNATDMTAIDAELARMSGTFAAEPIRKAKHDAPAVRLTDDGEFTESFIESVDEDAQQRRR
jgi:serine/threonine-protein kinase